METILEKKEVIIKVIKVMKELPGKKQPGNLQLFRVRP